MGTWAPRQWWAIATALAVVLVLPLATVEIPPLLDYPNHLARMFVIAHGGQDAFLSQVYAWHWSIIPNIAIDAIMPAMLLVMAPEVAGKLVLAATLLLPVAGCVAYHRASFGGRSLWPLASGLVAYNFLFLLGFMNFLLGIAAALFAAAGWIVLRRRRSGLAIAVTAPAAVVIFFLHIYGVALLGLLIGAQELVGLLAARRAGENLLRPLAAASLRIALVFAAPAALYAMSSFAGVSDGTAWQPLHWKLVQLFSGFMTYGTFGSLASALLVIMLMRRMLGARLARVDPAAAIACGVLIALYPLVPFYMKGTAFTDSRLPVMAAFLLFAGFQPQGLTRRHGALLTAGLAALLVARLAMLTLVWQGQSADLAQLRRILAQVAPESRVLVVEVTEDDAPDYWHRMPAHRMPAGGMQTFMHLPALLVTERDSMWPLMFTDPTKQPLAVRPAFRGVTQTAAGMLPDYRVLAAAQPPPASLADAPYLQDWQDKFDDVIVLLAGAAGDLTKLRPDLLELIDRTDFAALLRVRRTTAARAGGPTIR